jgi:hypothetical protein
MTANTIPIALDGKQVWLTLDKAKSYNDLSQLLKITEEGLGSAYDYAKLINKIASLWGNLHIAKAATAFITFTALFRPYPTLYQLCSVVKHIREDRPLISHIKKISELTHSLVEFPAMSHFAIATLKAIPGQILTRAQQLNAFCDVTDFFTYSAEYYERARINEVLSHMEGQEEYLQANENSRSYLVFKLIKAITATVASLCIFSSIPIISLIAPYMAMSYISASVGIISVTANIAAGYFKDYWCQHTLKIMYTNPAPAPVVLAAAVAV